MSSYTRKTTPSDGPDLNPPSYAELTAAKAREYGFAPEVIRPTTAPYPPSAPYPVSSQSVGQMPMPMPGPGPGLHTNLIYSMEQRTTTSRQQPSRVLALPRSNYQRMGTPTGRNVGTLRVSRDIKNDPRKMDPYPASSMCCVYIAIMLIVVFLTILGLILRRN